MVIVIVMEEHIPYMTLMLKMQFKVTLLLTYLNRIWLIVLLCLHWGNLNIHILINFMHHNSGNFVFNKGTVWFVLQSTWPFWSWKCFWLQNFWLYSNGKYLVTVFLSNLLVATTYKCNIVFAALQNEFKILKICRWARNKKQFIEGMETTFLLI